MLCDLFCFVFTHHFLPIAFCLVIVAKAISNLLAVRRELVIDELVIDECGGGGGAGRGGGGAALLNDTNTPARSADNHAAG